MLLLSPCSVNRNCLTKFMSYNVFLFVLAFSPFWSNYQLRYLSSSEQTYHQSFRFARRRKYLCRNLVVHLKISSCFSRRLIGEWKRYKRARCCDGNFLLAETEVVMTTVISSQVKDENCIFTGYKIFVTRKILVFHLCLCNNTLFCMYLLSLFSAFWKAISKLALILD